MIPYNSINQYIGANIELTYTDAMQISSDELRDLLFTKKVLVFKAWNNLTAREVGEFAAKFGTRWTYNQYTTIQEIARLDSCGNAYTKYKDTSYSRLLTGIPWHADIANEPNLPRYPARLLYCVSLPSDATGLSTDVSNLVVAFDDLSEEQKLELESVYYVYQSWQQIGTNIVEMPAIEIHPYTRQKFIRLNAVSSDRGWIRSWYKLNSDGTKTHLDNNQLKEIVIQIGEKYQYSHAWEVGDLIIWDNWGTMHRKGAGIIHKNSTGPREFLRLSVDTGLDDTYCNDHSDPK